MAEDGFIDVSKSTKRVVLTENDVTFIRDNPHGLTKEGCLAELWDWNNRSKNRYMQARYAAMAERCKTFTKSGKMKDGRTILARDIEGNPTWVEWLNIDYQRIPLRSVKDYGVVKVAGWEDLPEEKRL